MKTITKEEWAETRRESLARIPMLAIDGKLPDVLLRYQSLSTRLLETVSVLVVEKSRRIGFTWGLAAYAVLRCARAKDAGGMDGMYISYSQEMTREFVDACAMWAKAYALAAAPEEEFLFDDVNPSDPADTRRIQAFRIRFASGFEIIALSSAPRGLRGKQGFVIIDEAAFVDSLKELIKAALAFLMWGGQVIIVSTHNGAANDFNLLIQDVQAGRLPYKHMRVDLDDALRDGLYQRICLVTGKTWSPEAEAAWRADIIAFYGEGADEELFCVPSQGSGVWIAGPVIEARMVDAPVLRLSFQDSFTLEPEAARKREVQAWIDEQLAPVMRETLDVNLMSAIGIDIGRFRDATVMWPLQVTRVLRRVTPFVVELFRVPFQQQEQIRDYIVRGLPRCIGGRIDATGMGVQFAESALQTFGEAMAPVKISTEWYRLQTPPVKVAFDDDAIAIPRDAEILGDFRTMKQIKGVAQPPSIRVESATGGKRHGDAAIACILAYEATRFPIGEFDYRSGRPGFESDSNAGEMWRGERDHFAGDRRDGLW